jgi:hypothetical protein
LNDDSRGSPSGLSLFPRKIYTSSNETNERNDPEVLGLEEYKELYEYYEYYTVPVLFLFATFTAHIMSHYKGE